MKDERSKGKDPWLQVNWGKKFKYSLKNTSLSQSKGHLAEGNRKTTELS